MRWTAQRGGAAVSDAARALRQLRDCGIVRTRFHHAGFAELMGLGLADPAIVADDDRGPDWRLTDDGRDVAAEFLEEQS